MKTDFKKIFPLAIMAIALISVSPLASASTLTVNLNPKTGLATLDSVSTTKIIFTYPANSTMSNYLRNVSSSVGLSGKFDGNTPGAQELQGSFDDWDHHISVSNISVSLLYTAKGNTTALVVDKVTKVNATVTGAFNVVNGTVSVNMGWRAFIVRGAMNFPLEGHDVDVNLAGSAMEDSLSGHAYAAGWLANSFGRYGIWDRPTLNFSALNSPLSTWTKNYDSATNTTTFSKTISGQDTFSVSADFNGQKYSLSAVSDPSGVVTAQGYASASGDTLTLAPAPASASTSLLAVTVVAGLVIVTAGYLFLKSKAKTRTTSAASLPV
jgi:hypothetical protein